MVATIGENIGFGQGCCSEGVEGADDGAVRTVLEHEADAAGGFGRKAGCRGHGNGKVGCEGV